MIRRPPRSTRTDTLFPYTTLFRSCDSASILRTAPFVPPGEALGDALFKAAIDGAVEVRGRHAVGPVIIARKAVGRIMVVAVARAITQIFHQLRSDERRVGKECVSTFRSRW